MKTRLALAIMLAISAANISADPLKIKNMYIGMSVDDAIKALASALSVPTSDIVIINYYDDDNANTCLFMSSLKAELTAGGQKYCEMLHGNMSAILSASVQYTLSTIGENFKEYMEYAARNEKPPIKPLKQAIPLATFTNNEMVTMTLDGAIVDHIFSYGNTDFKEFATEMLDAYNIPSLERFKCSYFDGVCWEFNTGDGTVLSIINRQTKDTRLPPMINLFRAEKIKPLNF